MSNTFAMIRSMAPLFGIQSCNLKIFRCLYGKSGYTKSKLTNSFELTPSPFILLRYSYYYYYFFKFSSIFFIKSHHLFTPSYPISSRISLHLFSAITSRSLVLCKITRKMFPAVDDVRFTFLDWRLILWYRLSFSPAYQSFTPVITEAWVSLTETDASAGSGSVGVKCYPHESRGVSLAILSPLRYLV